MFWGQAFYINVAIKVKLQKIKKNVDIGII